MILIERQVEIKNQFVVNLFRKPAKKFLSKFLKISLGDILLEGGTYKNLASGIEYEEKRVFLANIFLVKFVFLTR